MYESEQLICEVECYPCLWKPDDDSFHDKVARRDAWNKIASALDPDWATTPSDTRKVAVEDVQKRWKNIRDCYRKEKQRRESGRKKKGRRYVFADVLKFLDEVIATSSFTKPATPSCQTETTENKKDAEKAPTNHVVKKTRFFHDETPPKAKIADSPNQLLQLFKRQQSQPREDEDMDDDKAFLMSLLPTLKRFDGDQKLEVRIAIMNAIREVQRQHRPESAPMSPPPPTSHPPLGFPTADSTMYAAAETSPVVPSTQPMFLTYAIKSSPKSPPSQEDYASEYEDSMNDSLGPSTSFSLLPN